VSRGKKNFNGKKTAIQNTAKCMEGNNIFFTKDIPVKQGRTHKQKKAPSE